MAQAAYDSGNTTNTYAQAGFSLANTNSTLITGIQAVNSSQNTSISDVNALAQAAYNSGNTTITYSQSGYAKANAANVLAQASYDRANTILSLTEDTTTNGGFFPIFTDSTSGTITSANVSYGLSYNPSQQRLDVGTFLSINGNTSTITAANLILSGTNISEKLQASYDSGNTTLIYAQSGYNKANTVASDLSTANTFLQANDATTLASAKSYADTLITNLVNSAPTTLDTLKELADALGDDPNFATTITTSIGQVRNHANGAFDKANTATTSAQAAFDKANTVSTTAQNAYDKANSAYNQANTDVTSISITAGDYGSASIVPVLHLEANGRVSAVTNTSIAIATSAITSGTLGVVRGGTGASSFTTKGVIVSDSSSTTGALSALTSSTEGHVLQINASGVPTFAHLNGGSF